MDASNRITRTPVPDPIGAHHGPVFGLASPASKARGKARRRGGGTTARSNVGPRSLVLFWPTVRRRDLVHLLSISLDDHTLLRGGSYVERRARLNAGAGSG